MKVSIKALCVLFTLIIGYATAQIPLSDSWTNGFSKPISGTVRVRYGFLLESDSVLTIRCLNNTDYIEWETGTVEPDVSGDDVTFVWGGAYSCSKSPEPRSFSLFTNNKFQFSFATASRTTDDDWSIKNDSAALSFKVVKIVPNNDGSKEFWGYFLLTVHRSELSADNTIRIKIKGDGSGSRHWYSTMEHPLSPEINISQEKVVYKDENGKLHQRLKVSIQNYALSQPVKIFSDGDEVVSANLNFGVNDFFINYDALNSSALKNIEVNINGRSIKSQIMLAPVKKMAFYLIPEAHVDIGYTELQTECEKKHWRNFDEAIRLAKQSVNYPEGSSFKWNVEVLWAVRSYLENFPEKRTQFIEAVKKGWINLDANYGNMLTGLCRPEELYKLNEYSNQLQKETGIKIESAMISDVPGYTWGIVQSLADNGIKYFSIGPNATDRLGGTLNVWGDKPFYWKSPSGEKKVLAWVTKKGYSWFHKWRLSNGDVSPILKYIDELDASGYPYDIVQLRYNIGGDNGFPDSLLSGFVKNWNEKHETPKFIISSTEQMFRDFENKYGSQIPTYSGDFTPFWEDGAASTANETAINRNTAELLTQLENINTIQGKSYQKQEFNEAWRNVLLFSEHTWGAFNSISEPDLKFVKDQWDAKRSYALKADSIAKKLYTDLAFTSNSDKSIITNVNVYNSASWNRTDVVTIPSSIKTNGDCVVDGKGTKINAQRLTTGELVFIAKDVPALGSKKYFFANKGSKNKKGKINNIDDKQTNSISNDFYKVTVNKGTGTFNITYISKNRDNEPAYDSLNAFIHTGKNASNPQSNGPVKISVKENSDVEKSLIVESTAPGCNKLTREIKLYNGIDKIEINDTIDKTKNYEKENLRFAFPFNIQNPETRIDIAWAVIRPEKDQLEGANKNYFTVQRWVDVSNSNKGITLAAVDAPFIEVGGMNAGNWNINESEERWATKAESSSLIYSWVMNNSWNTNYKASQEGVTTFRYALQPHSEFDYLKAYHFGIEQSQPLIALFDGQNPVAPFIKLDENTKIVVTSIKSSADDKSVIIKFYNPTNEFSSTEIKCPGKPSNKFYLSNGKEETVSELPGKLELKPFEVKIIKIEY
ncbi:MAG: glycoside hydrolase family 38 C-terminal domain-containing protein [Ignavibacteriaceae bacterium]|nr:glycoside hydrolase family 38 C-terminal domain-containing protein [Ignavibacteriaceae bacterium]